MDHLYFVAHTHWDREWYQPFQQMRARLVAMADKMIPLVESGAVPSFHFDGQTVVLEDYLAVRPEMAPRLKRLIGAGQVQVGPWFVLADSFLVSGESLIRNLEIGMSIARRFGKPLDVGYLPDQFGHTAQLPQILAGFGFRTAVLWRGVPAAIVRNRFVWEALDGSSVLTVYLPHGYGNGSVLALKSVESFLKRVGDIASRERPYADGAPILIMVGTDHTEPDPRLKERLGEARGAEGFSFEIGPLETYVKRLAELPPNGIVHHRGELRSPRRAHLLPGVTSARTWIKQRDFRNCGALERIADPLAALANFSGAPQSFENQLELAWRFELENHPHDSICGCSVDQVHEDMRYRFDQAALIAEDVAQRAVGAIFERAPDGEPAIAVFNPTFATRALVTANVELPDSSASYAIETGDGRRIPAAFEVATAEKPMEIDLAASEFKGWVGQLSGASVMGRAVNAYELRQSAGGRFQLDLFTSRTAIGAPPDIEAFRARVRAEIADDATVKVRMVSASRATVSFAADGLTRAGFSYFRVVRDQVSERTSAEPSSNSIENEFYRLRANGRGLEVT
ncbi:MAG TPA: hypothetical protein VEJ86_11435, partial [Candidatus Binataceae bacterium]|nr:hypothetical protein [Candidatus Binataceae bacterium]